jgi:outer membrane protein assembly factor BamB
VFSSPTVVGETVFVGSCKGLLYALDRYDGAVLWQYDITQDGEQSNFHGDPLLIDDTLYIGTDGTGGGFVYAFDPYTGDVLWNYPDDGGVATDILAVDDKIYATTLNDELICLDRDTGAPLWAYKSGYAREETVFNGTPAVVGDKIIFGGLDGMLGGLDAGSGEILWTQSLDDRVETSVLQLDGYVYAGTAAGNLYRVDASSGDVSSKLHTGKSPSQTILFDGVGLVVFLDWSLSSSEIVVIDTLLAGVSWRRSPPEGDKWTSARPYIVGDHVVVGSQNGFVQAYRDIDGEPAWSLQVEGKVRGMGFSDAAVFVGTLGGMVYCIDRKP